MYATCTQHSDDDDDDDDDADEKEGVRVGGWWWALPGSTHTHIFIYTYPHILTYIHTRLKKLEGKINGERGRIKREREKETCLIEVSALAVDQIKFINCWRKIMCAFQTIRTFCLTSQTRT